MGNYINLLAESSPEKHSSWNASPEWNDHKFDIYSYGSDEDSAEARNHDVLEDLSKITKTRNWEKRSNLTRSLEVLSST